MSELQTPEQGTEQQESVTPEIETQEPVALEPTAVEVETPSTEGTEPTTPEPQQEFVPKDKFVNSQRESILNAERVKAANARLEQLTKQDTPTDEAMRALYPIWDQLDEYNKSVLIRQETIAMQQARTIAEQQEIRDRQRLDDQLDEVIENNPKLHSKEAEFKRFARNPKNRGIDVSVLAKAFLYDGDDTPAPQSAPKPGLEKGSGGPKEPAKTEGMTLEQEAELMKANPGRYAELIRKGIIK